MFTEEQIQLAISTAKVCREAYLAGHKRGISNSRSLQIEARGLWDAYRVRLAAVVNAFNGDEGNAAEFMRMIYTSIYGEGARYQTNVHPPT